MATTSHTSAHQYGPSPVAVIRWRSWPLVAQPQWAWLLPVAVVALGASVWYLGGGWLLAITAAVGFAATLWQLWWPVDYELDSHGIRRIAFRWTRLYPWHAVRAYRLRPTGVILYHCPDPISIDLLRSQFIPFPEDEDEMLCALRDHLTHAVEIER